MTFQSHWLEDWDSVQFAMAMHNYNISENLPHAPGYILYIFAAKILYFFTGSDIASLTFLSALTGSFAIILVYLITKKMFNGKVGLLAALLFSIFPICLITSVSPLTNMPGLFSFLIFIYLIYSYPKKVALVSIVAGLILGFRATEAPVILSILALSYLKKSFIKFFTSFLYFALGVSFWLIPTVIISGVDGFVSSYRWIGSYVLLHDSIANQDIATRVQRINYLLTTSYSLPFILLSMFSIIFIISKWLKTKRYELLFLLVWLVSYLIPLLFVYNLEVPRYTLPLSVPLAVAASYVVFYLPRKINSKIMSVATISLAILILKQDFYQLKMLSSLTPPTISAVDFVKKNFNPSQATIISSFTFRHFQYYAPSFKNYLGIEKLTVSPTTPYVVIDYKGFIGSHLLREYNIIDEKTFTSPPEIFPRVNKTNLYILSRTDLPK